MIYYSIKPESFGQLGAVGKQVLECKGEIAQLKVKFLRPYGVAYLDQLMLNLRSRRPLSVLSVYPELNRYFKQTGFEHLAKKARMANPFPQRDIIRVKRFSGNPLDVEKDVVSWLTISVKPFLPVHSTKFWKKIVENFWEIVHNGLQHGQNTNGVSASGQFYPQMKYFEVAFYDAGHGIPNNVKSFGAKPTSASDYDCINWAVQVGNSTQPFDKSAGLGLHLLRQFLTINCGIFQIASGNGYYGQVGEEAPLQLTLKNSIRGTLVNIRVNYDEYMYKLKSEKQ